MSKSIHTFALLFLSAGLDFGAILVKPSRYLHEAKIPLVVYIHGLCLLHFCVVAVFLVQNGNMLKHFHFSYYNFSLFAPPGGPHSQFPVEWNCTTAGLAKLGFAVLMGKMPVFSQTHTHEELVFPP